VCSASGPFNDGRDQIFQYAGKRRGDVVRNGCHVVPTRYLNLSVAEIMRAKSRIRHPVRHVLTEDAIDEAAIVRWSLLILVVRESSLSREDVNLDREDIASRVW
jgi:hypothetical protein